LEGELYVNPHSAVAQFLASHPNDLDGIFTLVRTGHLTCGQSEHINPYVLFYQKRVTAAGRNRTAEIKHSDFRTHFAHKMETGS
jgi:hypothetical protein